MTQALLKIISLRQLVLLSTVGRELNLSRSAELLHTTQPALSRSLAQMESALGTRLLNRTTKRMSLTAAGMSLMQHANRILAELEMAQEELAGIEVGGSGEVRVGALPAFSTELLAQALAFTDPITGEDRRFESRRRLLPPSAWSPPNGA